MARFWFWTLLGLAFSTARIATAEYLGVRQGTDIRRLGIESYAHPVINNWAENVHFTPEVVFFPQSRDDVVRIVKDASSRGKKISMIGKGHSWNPLMEGTQYLISTVEMNRVWVDEDAKTVTVEPGATIASVDEVIEKRGLVAPCNVVGTTDITYGGIMATASHGAGRSCPTMSDFIEEIELVRGDGTVETYSEASHGADTMNLLRVNLGAMGLMSKIRFRVVPSFNVSLEDKAYPLGDLFKVLPGLLKKHETVEVLWFPFTPSVVLKVWDRTDAPLTPVSMAARFGREAKKKLLYVLFKAFIGRAFVHYQAWIPGIIRNLSPYVFPDWKRVARVHEAVHYVNEASKYPINETEIAIPFAFDDLSQIQKAWDAVVAIALREREYGRCPLNVVVHMRFLKGSAAPMSPSYGNENTCYLDFGSFHKTPGWTEVAREVWKTWKTLPGVKLHWAKDMRVYDDLDVPAMYGHDNVAKFLALRQKLDPQGVFLNGFLTQLFRLDQPATDRQQS